jgi:hypothetical protein
LPSQVLIWNSDTARIGGFIEGLGLFSLGALQNWDFVFVLSIGDCFLEENEWVGAKQKVMSQS